MVTMLIILGLLTWLVVAWPDIIVIGLFAGVLPGLILSVVPTAFAYLLAFTLLRELVPLAPGAGRNATAALLALGAGCLVALPAALAGRAAFALAVEPDVTPPDPVALSGRVRLERGRDLSLVDVAGKRAGACDALCAALLQTPGVTAVQITGRRRGSEEAVPPVTYQLAPAATAAQAGLAPTSPETIVEHLPEFKHQTPAPGGWKADIARLDARRDAIVAEWALKLAGSSRLVVAPDHATVADFTIAIGDGWPNAARVMVEEVVLSDRDGAVLLRRQLVRARPWMVPFACLPEGRGGLSQVFAVARTTLRSRAKHFHVEPVETLFARTNLHRPGIGTTADDGLERMRQALGAALRDPSPVSLPATLATAWFGRLDFKALGDADVATLVAAVGDARVHDLKKLYDWYDPERLSGVLREPITRRLARTDVTQETRGMLGALLRSAAPGTYALPTPLEEELLRDQAWRLQNPALVERLADRGADAAPLLATILAEDAQVSPWAKRSQVLAAARRALTRLGPQGVAALPTVNRLLADDRSSLTNNWRDGEDWRIAQVRMGVPPAEVAFPAGVTPESRAQSRAWLLKRLARFEKDGEIR